MWLSAAARQCCENCPLRRPIVHSLGLHVSNPWGEVYPCIGRSREPQHPRLSTPVLQCLSNSFCGPTPAKKWHIFSIPISNNLYRVEQTDAKFKNCRPKSNPPGSNLCLYCLTFSANGWLVGRLASPFSTKIGYIGDRVLGGDLVQPS